MKSSNYEAWDVDVKEFPKHGSIEDQLIFLLHYAILAPSSHNCQPWSFSVKNNTISIFTEPKRGLPVSDPEELLAHIAIGCAIENVNIAASFFGFDMRIDYFPNNNGLNCVVDLNFKKSSEVFITNNHRIFSIPKRCSNRNPYQDRMPEQQFLNSLSNLSSENTQISVITTQLMRNQIADLIVHWRLSLFDNRSFRQELSKYKRNNFSAAYTGMPGFTMGFSNLASLFTPFLVKHFNVTKLTKVKDLLLLKHQTPVFVIISSIDNTRQNALKVGQIFERCIIEAENRNIQTSISAIPKNNAVLQSILQTKFYPQIFFRLGYANKKTCHSPRLNLTQVMNRSI